MINNNRWSANKKLIGHKKDLKIIILKDKVTAIINHHKKILILKETPVTLK